MMDPVQARALDALEPFIALSKAATSTLAAVELIERVTSTPTTYVFAELLETPNIQSLRHAEPDQARHLRLLEVFAWGTWQEYRATPNLPPLNDAQSYKLRLLSLLSLCKDASRLTYGHLQNALSLPTRRALEDVVIGASNAGLITAKLSPSISVAHVSSISALRDLRPGSVTHMLASFSAWDARCAAVLDQMDGQVLAIRQRAVARVKDQEAIQSAAERGLNWNQIYGGVAIGGGGGGGGGNTGNGIASQNNHNNNKRAAADGLGSSPDPYDDLTAIVGAEDYLMDLDDALGQVDGITESSRAGQRKNPRTKFGGNFGRR